jgi:MazG family protein
MPRRPLPDDPKVIADMDDPVERLLAVMALLRHPTRGCPWDREQTLTSLKPYLVEETYEALDAIDSGDPGELRDELGDVLLQIAFQSQITKEAGQFDFYDVAESISRKLIRRHPHVFGESTARTPDDVMDLWEATKKREKGNDGLLSGLPSHLPALQKSHRMTQKAARVGFDWPDVKGVLDKVAEEASEVVAAATPEEQEAELGDLLFAIANLARHLNIDPEIALQKTNDRFRRRFAHVEKRSAQSGREMSDMTLTELDAFWNEAKARERT